MTSVTKKARVRRKPVECPDPFEPPADFLSALATSLETTVDRLRAQVPDFVWYWRKGAGAGKTKADWLATFRNRMSQLAEHGTLYVGASVARPLRPSDIRQKTPPGYDYTKHLAKPNGAG